MLSYQHIYHAGNLADVHKHALQCVMLEYMTRKDKPLSYLETHAGRGLYDLAAPEAVKTGEAAQGVARAGDWFTPDHPYSRAMEQVKLAHGPTSYPGSPLLAALSLRPTDAIHLAELHPREYAALRQTMRPYGAQLHNQDGLELAQSICPPTPRRGLILIDPSYEIKSDYAILPGQIAALHRKWNVGVIALWYPILTSGAHKPMLRALAQHSLPGALRHEVTFPPAREGHGMIGSGMFIVNAPWGTETEATRLSTLFKRL